jgi:ADP-ribosylglycohydrolase
MCVMTGFGGGGGHFGDTCGALVGAMAALGAVYGRREVPTDAKGRQGGTPWQPRPLPPL